MQRCRAELPEVCLPWLDAAFILRDDKAVFAPLLAGVILLIYGISVFRREYSRTACEESGDAGTDQEKRA